MKNITLLDIDLRLFDSAAASSGGEAPSGEGAAGQDTAQAVQDKRAVQGAILPKAENRPGRSRRARTGAYSNVVFGKQRDASGTEATRSDAGSEQGVGSADKSDIAATSDTLEAKRKAYRDLIEGEYREQYIEDTQRIVKERLKHHSAMEARLNAQRPIIDLLMQRYGVAEGNLPALQKAMEHDTSYREKAADKVGMPMEELRQRQQQKNQQYLDRLFRDAKQVRALYPEFDFGAQLKDQSFVNLLHGKLPMHRAYEVTREVEGVKALYPGFDPSIETADRNFVSMLRAGVPLRLAYEVKHMDEITAAAARNAAQLAGEQMTARVKLRSARPSENGTSSQSAVVVKSDVSKLTRKDRAEIARRVARGEHITF